MAIERTKILVSLEQDDSGYPPFDTESIWAIRTEEGYRVDNVPFYSPAIALGDVVQAEERDGAFRYVRTLRPSSNSLIRVVAYRGQDLESIQADLDGLGCVTEADARRYLIAVSVPPTASLSGIRAYLEERHRWGVLDYEEPILRAV
jgi:hypothetical protein